jgi:hypothetical protein
MGPSTFRETKSRYTRRGRCRKKLTNESPILGVALIYYGVLALDLLRNLVAQRILNILEPLAEISNSSNIFFSFFASLLASLKLSCKRISAFFGSVESLWKESQMAKTQYQKTKNRC